MGHTKEYKQSQKILYLKVLMAYLLDKTKRGCRGKRKLHSWASVWLSASLLLKSFRDQKAGTDKIKMSKDK